MIISSICHESFPPYVMTHVCLHMSWVMSSICHESCPMTHVCLHAVPHKLCMYVCVCVCVSMSPCSTSQATSGLMTSKRVMISLLQASSRSLLTCSRSFLTYSRSLFTCSKSLLTCSRSLLTCRLMHPRGLWSLYCRQIVGLFWLAVGLFWHVVGLLCSRSFL